jgi:hypothetical protein
MKAGDDDDLRMLARIEQDRLRRQSRDRMLAVARDLDTRKRAMIEQRRRARQRAERGYP